MNEIDEYIEAYFTAELNEADKRQFEERCVQDDIFARQVAFYITTREAIRQKLLEQKTQLWTDNKQHTVDYVDTIDATVVRKRFQVRWWSYEAAACFLIVIALFILYPNDTPRSFAENYIKDNYTVLSQTMNPAGDSIQLGIAAYNNKEYAKALQFFTKVSQAHPENANAKKYTGLTYLISKNYDKALLEFDELSRRKELYRNPGSFFKAVTLLKRNKPGDKIQARQLLEKVVNDNEFGSEEAREWLDKW